MQKILNFIFDDSIVIGKPIININEKRGVDRLYYEAVQKEQQKKNKLQQIKQQQEESQYQQQSFQPKISEISQILSKKFQRDKNQFYEYNIRWKQNVENKNKEIKQQEENEERLQQLDYQKQKVLEKAKNQSFQLPYEYKGPVKNWDQNVRKYNQNRSVIIENNYNFQPKINKNTEQLCQAKFYKENTLDLNVEDRLYQHKKIVEQKLQQKKEESFFLEQVSRNHNKSHSYYEILNHDDSYRQKNLYTNQNNKSKIEILKKEIQQEECPFKPQVNKLSVQMKKQLEEKRKPLYEVKKTQEFQQQQIKGNNKHIGTEQIEEFYTRNVLIPQHKKEKIKSNYELAKEIEVFQECTFKPKISEQSKQICNKIIHEDNNQSIYHRQLYLQQKKEQHLAQIKMHEEMNQTKGCTFKPKINSIQKQSDKKNKKETHLQFIQNFQNSSQVDERFMPYEDHNPNNNEFTQNNNIININKNNKNQIKKDNINLSDFHTNKFDTIQLKKEDIGNQNLFESG